LVELMVLYWAAWRAVLMAYWWVVQWADSRVES
jgi:hypothetical protein